MAGSRKPGPQCAHDDPPLNLDRGSLCLAQPQRPGPIGITPEQKGYPSGHFDPLPNRVLQLAADAVRRETTYAFDVPMLESLITFVVQTLKPLNFAEETVVRAKGAKEILDALGLNFLADSGESNWGHVPGPNQMRIATVSPAMRRYVDDEAGDTIASAVGVVARLTLTSIASHLVRLSSERVDIVMRHDIKISAPTMSSDRAVVQFIEKLRSSKLGDAFSVWVGKNWVNLLADERLRSAARTQSAIVGHRAEEREIEKPRPAASRQQPIHAPPTFAALDEKGADLTAPRKPVLQPAIPPPARPPLVPSKDHSITIAFAPAPDKKARPNFWPSFPDNDYYAEFYEALITDGPHRRYFDGSAQVTFSGIPAGENCAIKLPNSFDRLRAYFERVVRKGEL